LGNPNGFRSIYVWSVNDGQLHRVTSDLFDSGDLAWDPDGNYLYYIAVHDFQPALSQIEFDYAAGRGPGLFALALRKDVKNPFPPESDEVTLAKEGEKPASIDKAKPEEKGKRKGRKKSENRKNTFH
jgi:tricorn protease